MAVFPFFVCDRDTAVLWLPLNAQCLTSNSRHSLYNQMFTAIILKWTSRSDAGAGARRLHPAGNQEPASHTVSRKPSVVPSLSLLGKRKSFQMFLLKSRIIHLLENIYEATSSPHSWLKPWGNGPSMLSGRASLYVSSTLHPPPLGTEIFTLIHSPPISEQILWPLST